MNRDEFSKLTGINTETLRKYEKDFNIDVPRDSRNKRIYGQEELQKFLLIKQSLKDKSVSDLQVELSIQKEDVYRKNTTVEQPEIIENIKLLGDSVYNINTDIQELKGTLSQVNETALSELSIMARTISELSYKLGNFESSLKYEKEKYHDLISKYESEKRLISDFSSKTIDELKSSLSNKDEALTQKDLQLKDKDKEIEDLKKSLEKEKSKTLFQKIFPKGA